MLLDIRLNMKRTKGSQSELGMLYQYGVTALLAAELSANDEVEDYVLYSSEESAGKFDDVIARIKLKQEANWYLSLIQVKYKETKKLNVSDVLKGKSIEYFLSDYIGSFKTIMTNEAVTCRYGIPSENIRVAIFCDKGIQTPVYLRKECTFLITLDRYNGKQDISTTILPFGGKCWKFSSNDLVQTEYQRFFNGCYLYLEQPNHSKLNKYIQSICGIPSAKDVVNYVKDYFNNDFLYKQGLRKEVFEIELQNLRLCDIILPPTLFVDLTEDNRIDMWNKITLEHDVTVVNNEDTDILPCVYSCLAYYINKLLAIDVDWREYVYPSKELEDDVIKKFIAYSKTKHLRYWISVPNTLRALLLELWKCNAVPLILKTSEDVNNFEKYVHLGRSYIIIRDVKSSLQNVCNSKVKLFSCVNDIVNLQLRNSLLSNMLVSLQGRKSVTLMEILNDNELMRRFSCADIIGMMKKRTVSLKDDYLKSIKYAAFIIEDDKSADIVMPPEPYVSGGSIKIYCPSNKVEKCIEAVEKNTKYRDYAVYHLRWANNLLEIVKGNASVLHNCFMDQYGESLHIAELDKIAVIVGKIIMPEEFRRLRRYVKRATILPSIFELQQKQICLVSGDFDSFTENISFTCDKIEQLTFMEEKTYFFKNCTGENQDIWSKLCDLGCPIFEIKNKDGNMELLRYNHYKNMSSYISYDGKTISEDQFFQEVDTNAKKITVLTGEPGMGKTSLLKSLYNNSFSRKCILFYDLKDFQNHVRRGCMTNPLEFIFNEVHKRSSKKYKKLLRGFLITRKLILLLDSFDEVRSACEKQLLQLIRILVDSGVNIVIASRSEGSDAVIDEFSVEAVRIEPLPDDEEAEYFSYWKLSPDVLTNIPSELKTNPLYLNFLRIISENQEKISGKITKKVLYEKVIEMKIVRWLRSNNKVVRDSDVLEAVSLFEKLALVAMFGKKTVEDELLWICGKAILDYTKFGIITHFDESNIPVFCHRTFVEFLVAQWIVTAKDITIYKSFAKYVYRRLFNETKLNVLNILSEDLVLHRSIFSEDTSKVRRVLETDLKSLSSTDSLGRTALHLAVICCKRPSPPYQIVELIIKWMLRNHIDMNESDSIMGWTWTDYIKEEIFEYIWSYRRIATIKAYLRQKRERLDTFNILGDSFPSKYFFEIFRWATETNNFTVIQDLLGLHYYENKEFRKFYHAFLNNTVDTICQHFFELDMAITSLHIAAIYACIPMVRQLIQIGVDLDAIDGFTCTALHYSIMGCLSETTRNQPCDGYITNKTDTVKSPDTTHVHLNFIEILLEAGANSNVAFAFNGTSPLYFAVQTDNVSVVKTLLKFGAKVNDTCRDGNTALHAAALYGSLPIVECLLNHKADARLTNAKGETARDVAINQGNTDIVNLLAQPVETEKNILIKSYYDKECMGFVSNMEDENCSDETPRCLHSAARIGDINIIRHLVDTGLSINSQNMYGCTPLRIAARQGRVDVAKFLIEKGANVNTRDSFNISLLHSATWQENPMISELLLQNGANVNSLDYYGKTPLHHAIVHKSLQITKLLLEGGADVNIKCKHNNTSLHWAAAYGYESIVRLILEKGAELHTCDNVGYTAFHHAVERKHINIVKLLLEKGAHRDDYNTRGYTGLHLAIIEKSTDIVRLLLKEGVDANAPCLAHGFTPLHLAVIKQNCELVGILLNNGVNVNIESKSGYTPFFIAARERDINIVKLLLEYEGRLNIDDRSALIVTQCATNEGYPYISELLLRRGVVVKHFK